MKQIQTKDYLFLVDEKAKIKNDIFIGLKVEESQEDNHWILVTNKNKKDYVGSGIFAVAFKIIAYYPLTKEAKELDGLPLFPNPFENNNEIGGRRFNEQLWEDYRKPLNRSMSHLEREAFIKGYKVVQQSKQFSLEDMKKAIEMARRGISSNIGEFDLNALYGVEDDLKEVKHKYSDFDIIQSLYYQQLPKEFIPEFVKERKLNTDVNGDDGWIEKLKTIINSEGKQELVGTYKY